MHTDRDRAAAEGDRRCNRKAALSVDERRYISQVGNGRDGGEWVDGNGEDGGGDGRDRPDQGHGERRLDALLESAKVGGHVAEDEVSQDKTQQREDDLGQPRLPTARLFDRPVRRGFGRRRAHSLTLS